MDPLVAGFVLAMGALVEGSRLRQLAVRVIEASEPSVVARIKLANHLRDDYIPLRVVHKMARNHLHNVKQDALLLRFDLDVYVREPSGSYTRSTGARPPRKSSLFLPQVLDTSVGQRSAAVVGDRRRLVRWLTPSSPPQGVVYRTAPGSPGCYLSLVMATGGDDPVLYTKWSSAESMARRVPEHADVFGHSFFLYGVVVPLAIGDDRLLDALQDIERFVHDQFIVAGMRESVVVGGADPQEVARFRIAQAGRVHLIYQQAAVFAAQWITLHPQTES